MPVLMVVCFLEDTLLTQLAITLHLRTKKEMSAVPAHWETEVLSRIVNTKKKHSKETLLIGNGDVIDLHDAVEKVQKFGIDGVMLGRCIFGKPWLCSGKTPSHESCIEVALEHCLLFEQDDSKPYQTLKKHLRSYARGFPGASEFRNRLMQTVSLNEARDILNEMKALLREE
eukprot:TRINITY_DN9446_c1_g1_i1.p1 TRINITY_DN9446_c1_g1~~TRINITY_DN9446_c1_g1_i1.p1  ORF type:complete len:172 (+),score=31.02 TRINITY_DN9446_c1_g1_i1:529-1044(+)